VSLIFSAGGDQRQSVGEDIQRGGEGRLGLTQTDGGTGQVPEGVVHQIALRLETHDPSVVQGYRDLHQVGITEDLALLGGKVDGEHVALVDEVAFLPIWIPRQSKIGCCCNGLLRRAPRTSTGLEWSFLHKPTPAGDLHKQLPAVYMGGEDRLGSLPLPAETA
jgi:hypothetical protein